AAFLTTSLCFAEAVGGISRKFKNDEINEQEYLDACDELYALHRDNFFEIVDVGISTRDVFSEVEQMVAAHNRSKGKRLDLSDAFQLVTLKRVLPGLERSALLFVTADKYLAAAAKTEGFRTWYVMDGSVPP